MNKKSILVVIAILLFIIICGYLTGKNDSATDEYLSGKYNIEIKIKDYGTIDATLDADVAPITVTNFVDLVKSGYYTGLKFHRIIDGFMMQGGAGNSRNTIKGEFSSNGITNNISHVRGTISMARSSDPDSASTQFFIVQSDSTYLDGNYAAFGTVTNGMDVVDKVCKNVDVEDNNGTVALENQPVIEYIKVIE
ncbi:peptidyl-prolyl cis-trans isomerase [Firmicutes bacterium CAG:582]|nr:peptidyl-prolyl cis-trans isomerase [Firmicutes bacterium CAG:582]